MTNGSRRFMPMAEAKKAPTVTSKNPRRETKAPMARKKISTTVYVTPEQNEALHLLHNRTKVPVAVYIREGIDLVLAKHEEKLPGQLSLVDTSAKKS